MHEPAEALIIDRYIHLNPVRVCALGGHEGRSISPAGITAQLASEHVMLLSRPNAEALRGDPDQRPEINSLGVRRAPAEGLEWTEIVRAVVKIGGKPWEELLNGRGSGARERPFSQCNV